MVVENFIWKWIFVITAAEIITGSNTRHGQSEDAVWTRIVIMIELKVGRTSALCSSGTRASGKFGSVSFKHRISTRRSSIFNANVCERRTRMDEKNRREKKRESRWSMGHLFRAQSRPFLAKRAHISNREIRDKLTVYYRLNEFQWLPLNVKEMKYSWINSQGCTRYYRFVPMGITEIKWDFKERTFWTVCAPRKINYATLY